MKPLPFFKDEEGNKLFYRLLNHLKDLAAYMNNSSFTDSIAAFHADTLNTETNFCKELLNHLTKEIAKIDHGVHNHFVIEDPARLTKENRVTLLALVHKVANDTHAITKHIKSQFKTPLNAFIHADQKLFRNLGKLLESEEPPQNPE